MNVHVLLINGTINPIRWTAYKYAWLKSFNLKAEGADTAKSLQESKLLFLRGAR